MAGRITLFFLAINTLENIFPSNNKFPPSRYVLAINFFWPAFFVYENLAAILYALCIENCSFFPSRFTLLVIHSILNGENINTNQLLNIDCKNWCYLETVLRGEGGNVSVISEIGDRRLKDYGNLRMTFFFLIFQRFHIFGNFWN